MNLEDIMLSVVRQPQRTNTALYEVSKTGKFMESKVGCPGLEEGEMGSY